MLNSSSEYFQARSDQKIELFSCWLHWSALGLAGKKAIVFKIVGSSGLKFPALILNHFHSFYVQNRYKMKERYLVLKLGLYLNVFSSERVRKWGCINDLLGLFSSLRWGEEEWVKNCEKCGKIFYGWSLLRYKLGIQSRYTLIRNWSWTNPHLRSKMLIFKMVFHKPRVLPHLCPPQNF